MRHTCRASLVVMLIALNAKPTVCFCAFSAGLRDATAGEKIVRSIGQGRVGRGAAGPTESRGRARGSPRRPQLHLFGPLMEMGYKVCKHLYRTSIHGGVCISVCAPTCVRKNECMHVGAYTGVHAGTCVCRFICWTVCLFVRLYQHVIL